LTAAGPENPPARLQAIDAGQVHVHEHQVGLERTRGGHRGFTGGGFAHQFETWCELDHAARRASKRCLIVDNQHLYVPVLGLHFGAS